MADSNSEASSNLSAAVAQFRDLTGLDRAEAVQYLEPHGFDVNAAVADYFASADEIEYDDSDDQNLDNPTNPTPSEPVARKLDGTIVSSQPATMSSSSGNSKKPAKKFSSLRDLESDAASHGHGSGDEGDSDKAQEYFAGGDKSGLAVHNPGDEANRENERVQRLLETARARRGMPRPPAQDTPQAAPRFTGTGFTLGGDDTPSRVIPDVTAETRQRPQRAMVERILHLWSDGFSVDDGQLYRYDDPANQATLDMINRGAAPLELMNVEHGQEVDVKLMQHRGEKYVQQKPKYKPFSGSGQRLGSPTPGASSSSAGTITPSTGTQVPSSAEAASTVQIDDAQPTLSLQIRLGDGTRLPSRFNTTHTIGDVYAFVDSASAQSTQRPYTLMTTFPSKELSDKSQVLGDMAEFKRGGVIVQKWS